MLTPHETHRGYNITSLPANIIKTKKAIKTICFSWIFSGLAQLRKQNTQAKTLMRHSLPSLFVTGANDVSAVFSSSCVHSEEQRETSQNRSNVLFRSCCFGMKFAPHLCSNMRAEGSDNLRSRYLATSVLHLIKRQNELSLKSIIGLTWNSDKSSLLEIF